MAGQYLQRNPTSTGNRKVHTWSGWVKQNRLNTASSNNIWYVASAGNSEWRILITSTGNLIVSDYIPSPQGIAIQFQTEQLLRDHGNWFHLLVSVDTTKSNGADRVKIYINGVSITEFSSTTYGNQNHETRMNTPGEVNYLGQNTVGGGTYQAYCELFDVFLVDGQSLTPEVFGFYKDGNGYISAGSTQATDFRNGQWVPRTPREIKNLINDNGGFGVNGFYLPMNDSSNFGADFHTTPNSIITLKGENLPQPRNGAPTTTDAYVSQLREDPYAANLVLAVPGISTSTSANLVTNGTFDTNTAGWAAGNSAILSVENGALKIQGDGVTINGYATQQITTVIGERYTVNFDVIDSSSSAAWIRIGTSGGGVQVTSRNNNIQGTHSISFTATTTVTYITLMITVGIATRYTIVDNIVVKQEDAPRDYSADIKGSGTNKTLTANDNAGVGYEIPSYYGSALNFDGTGDYLRTTDNLSDFHFGTDDFTVEAWIWKSANGSSNYDGVISLGTNGNANDGWFLEVSATRGYFWYVNSAASSINYNVSPNTSQWNHICVERNNLNTTMYLNGVAVGIQTNSTYTIPTNATSLDIGGYGVGSGNYWYNGYIQDLRVYKGVAKYKGGFDVPKPYTPVGIESWRAVPDATANNFATWNPLFNGIGNLSVTNGNLSLTESTTSTSQMSGTVEVSSGKWYYETHIGANPFNGSVMCGIAPATRPSSNVQNRTSYRSNGDVYSDTGGSAVQSGTTYTTGDIIGVAFDVDAKKLWFAKNGSWVYSGEPSTGGNTAVTLTLDAYSPFTAFDGGAGTAIINSNFGQNPTFSGNTTAGTYTDSNGKGLFKYQPPSGFLALCEDNLPTPTIKDPGEHFKTVLWTGDGANGRSITGVGFKSDFVWIKNRANGVANSWHSLSNSVTPGRLFSNDPAGEDSFKDVGSFDTDGMTINYGSYVNTSGGTYVAWCWKAGGAAVENTDGTITSQVSVNQDAGFSIVSWTSTGSNDALQTVGHGLNTAPNMIILKNRDATVNWRVYHSGITSGNSLTLNSTEASYSFWPSVGNDTFGLANSTTTGQASGTGNQDIIAYCWSEIEGFSKFGSYVGNASTDGPFVYCGFKPAFVMTKRTDNASNWIILDSSRGPTNPDLGWLYPNLSYFEEHGSGRHVDFLSNGFKLRTAGTDINPSGTYIFAAFAESPFTTANAK